MAKVLRHGSCHCGAVRCEVALDFSEKTHKCNCSMCRKARDWSIFVKPAAFRLISGEGSLRDYQFGAATTHWLFCQTCGVRSFGRGSSEALGGDFVTVAASCLDDATVEELSRLPVIYLNGREDDWDNAPDAAACRLL